MKFRYFAVLNLFVVTVITLILWLLMLGEVSKPVVFTIFVMMGPLNILAMLGFWGTSGRLFTLRQGKRLFGLIDAGLIIGIIISSYAIPVLLSFGLSTHNIILLSAVAVLVGTFLQHIIGRTHSMGDTAALRKGSVSAAITMFRKDSYIFNMGVFVAVSVMTAFFVQYSFMAVTREQYPLEADMASFLGKFIGSMMIFTLFLKTFLFSYLIRNYGLKVILLLPPFLLMIFTAAAAGLGSSFGYTPAAGGFMLFFLILALSRLFSKALRDAVETPSFKVIYQTINEKVRHDVQSIVDGTVNEIAALASGLLLSGLGIIVVGRLISFSWVLLAITVIWVLSGLKLYREYRGAIIRTLDDTRHTAGTNGQEILTDRAVGTFQARMILRAAYPALIDQDFSILENNGKGLLADELIILAGEASDLYLVPALKFISAGKGFSSETRKKAGDTAAKISAGEHFRKDTFLDTSPGRETVELLSGTRTPSPASLLSTLRDGSPASKRAAIVMISKHGITDMTPEVCELVARPETAIDAISVLERAGSGTSGEIIRVFLRSSGHTIMMKNLLGVLGKSYFNEASGFIYQMLRTNSRVIRGKAAEILVRNNYRVPAEEIDKMLQFISEVIGILTWHIQAAVTLKRSDNSELEEALAREKNWWSDFLFSLLSITYDSQHIARIRENLDTGTVESVNFALEMIDLVVDESIKPKLICSVDISDNEDKLKSLHHFYPGFVPQYHNLLIEVINRDYNLISLWTKAVAVRSLAKQEHSSVTGLTLSS
ncbi:MAG: hypothetical protein FJY11_06800, partial [Bacteroidetes bacterium]|nr:hypothetical protein [Bacteroidota bacterium]